MLEEENLNASPKNAPRESEIIAQAAGRRCAAGVVSIATNMAGCGSLLIFFLVVTPRQWLASHQDEIHLDGTRCYSWSNP
jgi:hypothetical protein